MTQARHWRIREASVGEITILPSLVLKISFITIVQGHGYHFSVDGVQVLDTPWNNISCQGFQVFFILSFINCFQFQGSYSFFSCNFQITVLFSVHIV